MKQVTFILWAICLIAWGGTLGKVPLLPASKRIQTAYLAWKKHPESVALQKNFLTAFPQTKAVFVAVFYPAENDQLSSASDEYLSALEKIGTTSPGAVMQICLNIGKEFPRGSDAIAYLQQNTVTLALAHPKVFVTTAKSLTDKERQSLFRFLADAEAIEDWPEYGYLIQKMTKSGALTYAAELRQARQWRTHRPND
ncbi:MAG: hypothetical protein ACRYFX_02575 [Janthinobacterium lividum]